MLYAKDTTMTIQIENENDPQATFRDLEHCCFCDKPTPYWHKPKDVAVCPSCAAVNDPEDVPSKADWCAAHKSKHPSWYTQW